MADHAGFDPSEVYLYRGEGRIPRNAVRVEVHRSVKFIPNGLFQGCDRLESVLLREGLLRIGDRAFNLCSSLRVFRCPSTVVEIGKRAFDGCFSLTLVELPEGLESIEDWTFFYTSLQEVQIPASVARLGAKTFYFCMNLVSVVLREGLLTIGNGVFTGCWSLENLCIPSSVVEIGDMAFFGCRNLSSVELHEDLANIGVFAFKGCASLQSFRFVRLSERMEAIGMDDQMRSMFDGRLSEMTLAMTEEEQPVDLWGKCKKSLQRAHKVLTTYFELKGAAPVLELASWKAKIDDERETAMQGGLAHYKDGGMDLNDAVRERKRLKVTKGIDQDPQLSREECRVKCGAGIVFREVLKFFAPSLRWPGLDDSAYVESAGEN